MKIIAHNRPTLGPEENQAALRVLHSGWLAQGAEVEALECDFCDFLRLPYGHAVAVSSGTAALYLSLRALEAKTKKIAVSVYCCSALTNAVAMSGAEAVCIDTSPGLPNMDLNALTQSGVGTAIVPHMFGLPLDLSNFSDLDVIEDCAQALGAAVKGTPVGLQAKMGIYSFYATKLMTTGGQGGMIVSRDRSLADQIRDFREFDCRRDRKSRFNFQMTDLQAAIGRCQLAKLPALLARRSEIFRRYQNAGLELLDVAVTADCTPVRYRAVMKTASPAQTLASLEARGVRAIVPIEKWELLDAEASYPNAHRFSQETVSLPLYPTLTDEEVDIVISAVTKQ
jgi:perosamine synthetase